MLCQSNAAQTQQNVGKFSSSICFTWTKMFQGILVSTGHFCDQIWKTCVRFMGFEPQPKVP